MRTILLLFCFVSSIQAQFHSPGYVANLTSAASGTGATPWSGPTNAYMWYSTSKTNMNNGDIVRWMADSSGAFGQNVWTAPAAVYWTNNYIGTNPAVFFNSGLATGLTNTSASLSQPFTVVMVLNATNNNGAYAYAFDNITSTRTYYRWGMTVTAKVNAGTELAASGYMTNSPVILVVGFHGTTSFARTNGVNFAQGDAGANAPTGFTIGNQYSHTSTAGIVGGWCEFIVFNGLPATNDLQWVEYNLGLQYGITTHTIYAP